jgi:hypothetical protein
MMQREMKDRAMRPVRRHCKMELSTPHRDSNFCLRSRQQSVKSK